MPQTNTTTIETVIDLYKRYPDFFTLQVEDLDRYYQEVFNIDQDMQTFLHNLELAFRKDAQALYLNQFGKAGGASIYHFQPPYFQGKGVIQQHIQTSLNTQYQTIVKKYKSAMSIFGSLDDPRNLEEFFASCPNAAKCIAEHADGVKQSAQTWCSKFGSLENKKYLSEKTAKLTQPNRKENKPIDDYPFENVTARQAFFEPVLSELDALAELVSPQRYQKLVDRAINERIFILGVLNNLSLYITDSLTDKKYAVPANERKKLLEDPLRKMLFELFISKSSVNNDRYRQEIMATVEKTIDDFIQQNEKTLAPYKKIIGGIFQQPKTQASVTPYKPFISKYKQEEKTLITERIETNPHIGAILTPLFEGHKKNKGNIIGEAIKTLIEKIIQACALKDNARVAEKIQKIFNDDNSTINYVFTSYDEIEEFQHNVDNIKNGFSTSYQCN